ncbi:MAG: PAS domain-containing protein [Spirochaetales bacterium]|nr:PAS domain-containing protein [Spirochaetales bacterium]
MDLNKHWQHIIASLPDGITITDTKGKVVFVSDIIIRIFGADSDKEILGTNLINWIHPEDRDKAAFYI